MRAGARYERTLPIAVICLACSSEESAAPGAGGAEAGVDAPIEVSVPEAAPVDAEADSDAPSIQEPLAPCHDIPPSTEPVPAGFPGGAKRLPALPADVHVFEVPPPPEPLEWKGCGDGCQELVPAWAEGMEGPLTRGSVVGSC